MPQRARDRAEHTERRKHDGRQVDEQRGNDVDLHLFHDLPHEREQTRQAVYDAFTGLLGQKKYASITVQEIIDRANIGRSTFYAHFETKDDLLKSLCAEIFEHVFSEELQKEKTHDFSAAHDTGAMITHILFHLQEHMAYLPGILSGESGEIFLSSFKEQLKGLFARSGAASGGAVPREYILNHMVCDFAETVRWWTQNRQYTPEEISSFFLQTTPLLE